MTGWKPLSPWSFDEKDLHCNTCCSTPTLQALRFPRVTITDATYHFNAFAE
jgi:hypothetical protein